MGTQASDLATYAKAIEALTEADPVFGHSIKRIGSCRLACEIKPMTTTFEALLEAITHQQLSTKAAATIYSRVRSLAPELVPEQFMDVQADQLREAGLSRAKTVAVFDLAERTATGKVPTLEALPDMDDLSIIDVLSQIRGIGRWSAEMLNIVGNVGDPIEVLQVGTFGGWLSYPDD